MNESGNISKFLKQHYATEVDIVLRIAKEQPKKQGVSKFIRLKAKGLTLPTIDLFSSAFLVLSHANSLVPEVPCSSELE